jgi:hypothetical protein
VTLRADAAPGSTRLPRVTVVLLAGAVVHVVVSVLARAAVQVIADFSPAAMVSYALGAMPLVLAAAILAGRDRWPAGRGWLAAGAVAYMVAAVLDIVLWLTLATFPPAVPGEPYQTFATVRGALWLAASFAAPLLAAAGLWREGNPSVDAAPPAARWLAVALGALVLVLAVVPLIGSFGSPRSFTTFFADQPVLLTLTVLVLFTPVALAVLGLAAVRAIPCRYVLPEVLVAVGSFAAAIGSAAMSAASTVLDDAAWQGLVGPAVTASQAVALIGLAIVALGFFTARISAPGER